MLKTFCKWQAHLPSKTGPYDVALLLTRWSHGCPVFFLNLHK
jgi:hypothetical protein